MEIKNPTPEEYVERVSERNRMLIYNLTVLSSSLYSMWYDLHTDLKKDLIHLDKKLVKNYKRLGKLSESITNCLLHLCPIEKCSDKDQDLHIEWSDVFESYLKCLLNILIVLPSEDPSKFVDLFEHMDKLTNKKLVDYNTPDWNTFFTVLGVEPETTKENEQEN